MPKTGKQRAQRIDRSYHQLTDPFLVRKRWMGVLGFAIALLYSAWLFSSRGVSHLSPGPLSKAHAPQEANCQSCHQAFTPIRTDTMGGSDPDAIAQNNRSCIQTCHSNLGGHFEPLTQPQALAGQACSQCHDEHQGREHRLADVADANCIGCHSELNKASVSPTANSSVTQFSVASHPPFFFESKTVDPSTLKFSHEQHLRPGQPTRPGGKDARGNHTLQCNDCHVRDVQPTEVANAHSSQPPLASTSVLANRHQTFKPVEFKKHCVGCHDLNGIEHGLDREKTLKSIDSQLPNLQRAFAQSEAGKSGAIDLKERESRLQAMMYASLEGCSKCHVPAAEDASAIVEPTRVRARWFQHAAFSHGQHLSVSCSKCHAQAYATNNRRVDSELEADQVMLPGIAICAECHIADPVLRNQKAGTQPLVSSADCIDCHRFHIDPPRLRQPTARLLPPLQSLSASQTDTRAWMALLRGDRQP